MKDIPLLEIQRPHFGIEFIIVKYIAFPYCFFHTVLLVILLFQYLQFLCEINFNFMFSATASMNLNITFKLVILCFKFFPVVCVNES